MIDVATLSDEQLDTVVNWRRFTNECEMEQRRRRYDGNTISKPKSEPHEGDKAEREAVKVYEGKRKTFQDKDGTLMAHCPWCGHPSRYARSRKDESGQGVGGVFFCKHCPTWFDERGVGILPQDL